MDIQSKVAARRAELAKEAAARAELAKRQAAENLRREGQQREAETRKLATDLAKNGAPVTSDGTELSLTEESPLAALDPADFKRNALQGLLNKEARRRFTPSENWGMIAPVSAGLPILFGSPLLGLVLLGTGLALRSHFMRRHRNELRAEFPQLFPDT